MSGLHGVLRFDGADVRDSDLARQANRLAHRGPDRRGQWRDGPIGLGHLLLRVTREDDFETQPLRQDRIALVADARLDNRDALAAALTIETPETLPDSAFILKAYAQWGEACVEHLIGDFAFALWDGARNTLLLARDHMGQRHLHYHIGKDALVFASEVKGLSALPDVPETLDDAMLARRLMVDRTPTGGATIFKNIFGLEGGTILRASPSGEIATQRYWQPKADPRHLNRNDAYYVQAYRETLAEAVACRVSRVRQSPALMLGGGFDSGAIAGLSGNALPSGRKLVCVTSVGTDPTRGVRKWANILARHMPHLDLHFVTRDGIDVLTGMQRNFLESSEPYSPNRYAAQALCREAAGAGARVLMDGHGGDYTLNPKGTGWLARRLLRGELALFLREFHAYRRHSRATLASAIRSEIVSQILPAPLARLWHRLRTGLPLRGPAAPVTPALIDLARSDDGEIATGPWRRSNEPAPQMSAILRRQQSGHVAGGALLAAAHGLEFTQPFHDKRVVELALAIPEHLHVKNGRDRHLARLALADIYPPEFQSRGRANDSLIPDFEQMMARATPQFDTEIARLEQDKHLAKLFDFPRMRAMLAPRSSEVAMRHAARTFLHARFAEWHRRDNRS